MAGRNCADIVFCIDASGSMQPCFDAVRNNVEKLIEGLQTDANVNWDIRFDLLAFHDSVEKGGFFHAGGEVHFYRSVNCGPVELVENIYKTRNAAPFFTKDLSKLKAAMQETPMEGEEMQLLALDIAMDFPWRDSANCHRVVILLTDEPVETGIQIERQVEQIERMKQKLQEKKIKLFIIAPESDAFFKMAEADRCEYTDLEASQDGLRTVDFSKMLATIGRSVSVSQSYDGAKTDPDPSFDQLEWTATSGTTWSQDK